MSNSARASVRQDFEKNIANHVMTVSVNEGVHRVLRFKNPDSCILWFDIATWPGHLCIAGDCGSYVFTRLMDMFNFFRGEPGRINPGYWAQKVVAQDKHCGITEWDPDRFVSNVVDVIRSFYSYGNKHEQLVRFREARRDLFPIADEGKDTARLALFSSRLNGAILQDLSERDNGRFTYQYIWCLHAIVWGIAKFDEWQARQMPVVTP